MCRSKLQILRFLLGEGSSSVVPSSTSPEVPTGLEGGPTVECRLKSSMRPMFAAMQLIWLALWFLLASFQLKTQWVHHYFVQAKHQRVKRTFSVHKCEIRPTHCIIISIKLRILSFSAACWSTGLHHIHWLQHFFPLFTRLHCLLHFAAVSHVRIMNAYPTIDRCQSRVDE